MCLLTFINEYTIPNIDHLTCGAENNPDGFGFAIHDGTSIIRYSSLNYEQTLDKFLTYRRNHNGPALFHSRITTHGGTSLDNCHPFQLGKDDLTVVAHNGMLPIKEDNGRSDTRIFAEDLMPSWGGASLLNTKRQRKRIGKFAEGSKLVFLSANPAVLNDYYIINEHMGHWDNGVWWSNTSYKYSRYSYSGGTMYASGWSKVPTKGTTPQGTADYYDDWFVQDCTYVTEDGEEVWGEMWRCTICDHVTYVDEDNIDMADFCESCDACWFCASDRVLCRCNWVPQSEVHSIAGYDSAIDYHF